MYTTIKSYLAPVYVVELIAHVSFLYDAISRKKENKVNFGADVPQKAVFNVLQKWNLLQKP